ncbi:MAG: dTMP kinase [Alphaproteobacteria bacterium]|nr:dTMP kinase [Alphaproteobacteria bacterium]
MTGTARFVTFEGGEGAGKSTQIKRLGERLAVTTIAHMTTREPGGSPGAEAIRRLLVAGDTSRWEPLTEALLMLAARRDHWLSTIAPALDRGKWVLSDRFHDSTVAYQGHGRGVPLDALESLRRLILGDRRPDLTLILDLPVAEGLERARARMKGFATGEDRFERMDSGFHERMRAGFLAIARAEPTRCVVIDARPDADAVHAAIVAAVSARLGVAL